MKNYSKQNYSNYAEYAAELNADLMKELRTFTFTRGEVEGQAIRIKVSDHSDDIFADVKYPDRECTLSLRTSILRELIRPSDEVKEILTRYLETTKTSYTIYEAEEKAEYQRQQEEARKIREEQLEKAKFEKRKLKSLEKLNTLRPEKTSKLFNSPMSHYEALGWLAKHTKSIKASMPDYMEQWFIKTFGHDAERYVVDSTKKTSGGFPMQWSLSCKISFDTEASGILAQKATSANKKAIDNVTFVWDLIENYGFTFSKDQNVDKILEEIPTQYLEDFRRGYAM